MMDPMHEACEGVVCVVCEVVPSVCCRRGSELIYGWLMRAG